MKRLLSLTTIIALAFALAACGSKTVNGNGIITSQARKVTTFNKLNVVGNFQVTVTNGTQSAVTVVADTNITPYVMATVKNGELTITTRDSHSLKPSQPIQVKVGIKKLTKLTAEGNSTIDVNRISGNSFDLSALGNTKVILAGTTDQSTISVTGITKLDAKNLLAKEMNLTVTGDSTASVYAKSKLQVKITGNSKVTYFGKPPVINRSVYGKGKLVKGGAITS